jgi:hypothetical protein
MNGRTIGCFLLCFLISCGIAFSQGFSGDARNIAMGGIGHDDNIATKMIEDEREYSSIVIPLGLLQLIADRDRFDPRNKGKFDPILGLEYAANPLPLVFGRNPGGSEYKFVSDVINGNFSLNYRDLNTYRGFVPTNHLRSEGIISPSWGKTIKFRKREDGMFQSFYVGVGPYLSVRNDLNIDKGLTDILGSSSPVYVANKQFTIENATAGQLAMAVTLGYRGRFALPGRKDAEKSKRDGLYVGVNYRYLKGFAYENPDVTVRLNTDSAGLLTLTTANPAAAPVVIDNRYAHSGSGFTFDVGVGAVLDRWEFGVGANGLGNRINWDGMVYKQFTMASLSNGGQMIGQRLPIASSLQVKMPVEYVWNAGYRQKAWSAAVQMSHGLQGYGFHGGAEYRLLLFEFRGGLRYGLDRWHPSGGVGLNLGKRFSIDAALLGSTTNIERNLKPAMVVSLRFNHLKT